MRACGTVLDRRMNSVRLVRLRVEYSYPYRSDKSDRIERRSKSSHLVRSRILRVAGLLWPAQPQAKKLRAVHVYAAMWSGPYAMWSGDATQARLAYL
eukprot:4501284-Prymnesium_polylepis.1